MGEDKQRCQDWTHNIQGIRSHRLVNNYAVDRLPLPLLNNFRVRLWLRVATTCALFKLVFIIWVSSAADPPRWQVAVTSHGGIAFMLTVGC